MKEKNKFGSAGIGSGTGSTYDEETLDMLRRGLATDPRTTETLIRVEVLDGRVILRGETPSTEGRLAAEDVAWAVPGVHEVVNDIVPARRERQSEVHRPRE